MQEEASTMLFRLSRILPLQSRRAAASGRSFLYLPVARALANKVFVYHPAS